MADRDVIARLDPVILIAAQCHLVPVFADLLNLARAQIVHVGVLHKPSDWVKHNGAAQGTVLQKHPILWVAIMPLHNDTTCQDACPSF